MSERTFARMSDPLRDRLAAALGPNYELQRLLGKGGMGSVYLAREVALDRLVAVKVLPPEVTSDPETRERFRREARTAARLTHPHIVPLHTFGEAEGLLWFVMGYVAGETLAAKLERTPRADPELTRRVLGEIADALDHAHGLGIVHRDVKPENILIEDATGKALLADFGVARAGTGATTLTTAGALVGTPLYMSPEQASGERDIDGRADLYSLGVVGYRMLAGRTPFEGGDLRAVLAAHITQPAPALPADVPDDLGRALARALAKNSVERWGSGRDFRDAVGAGGTVSDEELDAMGALPSIVPTAVGVALLGILAWVFIRAGRPWTGFWEDRANVWLLMPLGQLFAVGAVLLGARRRLHRSWGELVRIACWAPAWWKWPWPARFRRPGDLWARLPAGLRRMRGGVLVMIACALGFGLTMLYAARLGMDRGPSPVPLVVTVAGVVLAEAYVFGSLFRLRKRLGLSTDATMRLLTKRTWNDPFWKRPEIARLLTSAATGGERRTPGEPRELAAEVRRVANALPSHHSALAQEAVARAEEMAHRIARMDAELAGLAAEVRTEDLGAVERKLADLGPSRADEPEARRAIRTMNEQQLAILRRLSQQLEEGQARREALAGMLRTLYLQVSELKIATARLSEADTSGVRAIVDRMGREVEGLREVGG